MTAPDLTGVRRVLLLLAAAGIAVWLCWPGATPPVDAAVAAGAPTPATASHPAGSAGDSGPRPPRAALPAPAPVDAGPPAADFDALVEQLVAIAAAADRSVRDGQSVTADSDTRAAAVLRRIDTEIADPYQRALHKLTELPSEDTSTAGTLRRQVCVGILRRGLGRRLAAFEHGASRRRLDLLVTSMLDSIPLGERVARDLGDLLTGTPYLGVAHEPPVLNLIAVAAEDRYLLPVATGILETLWSNLQASGARTSRELIHLALIFRQQTNPAKRLVAMRFLLTADGGIYREFVLREALAARDEALIMELTTTVADALPPDEAVQVLERLSLGTERPITMPLMRLCLRDAAVLRAAYEQKLADGNRPDYRAELITAAGFRNGAEGLELAQLAFANDPDPEVRTRALFAITGNAEPAVAERALGAALDDDSFARDPDRLGALVGALQNLARGGDHNAVDRIGRRLAGQPGLRPGDRRQLDLILRRVLPRDATLPPGWGRAGKE